MTKQRKIEIIFNKKGITTKSNVSFSSAEVMQAVFMLLRNIDRDAFAGFVQILQREE